MSVSIFAPPDFNSVKKYQVNNASAQECIYQPLYDTLSYPAAGVSTLTFFQLPIGQAGKTLAQTNMQQAGALPNPKYFLITDIQLAIYPGVNPQYSGVAEAAASLNFVNDIWAIFKASAGSLVLNIGSKAYLFDAPLCKFPPDHGFTGSVTMTNGATAAPSNGGIQYFRPAGDIYRVVPLLLIPQQNFDVTVTWPGAAIALPSGQAANIVCTLGGFQYRLSQ